MQRRAAEESLTDHGKDNSNGRAHVGDAIRHKPGILGFLRQIGFMGATGSIRHCRGCSSSMARRHSAKRSETPSVWPPPSSAARSTRAVTSSSACPNICTRASRRRSVRPGTRTTQTRPSGSCATWPDVWSMRNRASRAASWRGWRRSSPSSASACRTNSGARSPAPTSSRTRSARCVRSPATSNAGGTPRWRSDGPPPACWRPRKPSVASRPIPLCQPH